MGPSGGAVRCWLLTLVRVGTLVVVDVPTLVVACWSVPAVVVTCAKSVIDEGCWSSCVLNTTLYMSSVPSSTVSNVIDWSKVVSDMSKVRSIEASLAPCSGSTCVDVNSRTFEFNTAGYIDMFWIITAKVLLVALYAGVWANIDQDGTWVKPSWISNICKSGCDISSLGVSSTILWAPGANCVSVVVLHSTLLL